VAGAKVSGVGKEDGTRVRKVHTWGELSNRKNGGLRRGGGGRSCKGRGGMAMRGKKGLEEPRCD